MHRQQTAFENIVRKEELARTKQSESENQKNVSPFVHIFDIFLFAAEFQDSKISIQGKGLTKLQNFAI